MGRRESDHDLRERSGLGRRGVEERAGSSLPVRAFLQPIAPPSVLGFFGFAAATFIVSANFAHWYGTSPTAATGTQAFLAPLLVAFGGIAQLSSAMWSFKARDPIGTSMHGSWGAFWIAYGLMRILAGTGAITLKPAVTLPALGYWFAALSAITLMGFVAALAENIGIAAVLGFLWTGAGLFAVGFLTGAGFWTVIGAYLLIVSALFAWYTAGALMIKAAFGRPILPVGDTRRTREAPDVNPGVGEPGVMRGQQ